MITNIQIPNICSVGNHARILFDHSGIAYPPADYEYSQFFAADFLDDQVLSDLRDCLNNYTHTSWAEIKVQL